MTGDKLLTACRHRLREKWREWIMTGSLSWSLRGLVVATLESGMGFTSTLCHLCIICTCTEIYFMCVLEDPASQTTLLNTARAEYVWRCLSRHECVMVSHNHRLNSCELSMQLCEIVASNTEFSISVCGMDRQFCSSSVPKSESCCLPTESCCVPTEYQVGFLNLKAVVSPQAPGGGGGG